MRLAELLEGECFTTRLTRRVGRVVAHRETGVVVEWVPDRQTGLPGIHTQVHPEVDVDVGVE